MKRFIKTSCWVAAALIGMHLIFPPIRDGTDRQRWKTESRLLGVVYSVRAYEAITGRYPPTDPTALASSLRVVTNMIDGELLELSLVPPHAMGSKGALVDVWGSLIEVRIEPTMGIITALSPGRNRTWDAGTNDDIVLTITKSDDRLPPVTTGEKRGAARDAMPAP
jgi:hypothetical protein